MEQAIFCNLRKEIFESLKKRVSDFKDGYRQNIAILGEELCGKTTLLKSLLNELNDEKLIPVYCDIVPFEFSLFLKRCLNSLLYNFLKKTQLLSSRENLEMLVKRAKEALPKTAPQIELFLAHIDKDKPEALFKELFAIIENFAEETQKHCVIIFDEFHHLKQFGPKNIWQELGKKIMFHKNTLFIFSSSAKHEAKDILANELTLLFGNFETLELGMLNPAQSSELIRCRLNDIQIASEITSFLIHFTGGHPFYLKTICDEAVSACLSLKKTAIDKDMIAASLERILFNDWGILNQKFTNSLSQLTTNRNKNEYIYLLGAIATGKNRIKDLASFFRRQRAELNQKLKKLTELNIISKNGSFYQLNDRLMSFWLKFVLVEKLNALDPDHCEQSSNFKNSIAAEIEEFIKASRKDVADRMFDLFNLFEGDTLQIDKKRFQLSTFKELKIIRFENTDLKIGLFAKSQDSLWLAAIKEDGIDEKDVNEFLQSIKRFKHGKTVNKLIICLGGIERNARLLAKESQILTWDIANINSLMDIYGKPRIIKCA
ncbi:MAG TPA: hypothetical protein DCL35_00425 [Candidatus Omnitrophica bacterium]|nr:hypothetical protein [Candidatus Omnitrophota bacterium]